MSQHPPNSFQSCAGCAVLVLLIGGAVAFFFLYVAKETGESMLRTQSPAPLEQTGESSLDPAP